MARFRFSPLKNSSRRVNLLKATFAKRFPGKPFHCKQTKYIVFFVVSVLLRGSNIKYYPALERRKSIEALPTKLPVVWGLIWRWCRTFLMFARDKAAKVFDPREVNEKTWKEMTAVFKALCNYKVTIWGYTWKNAGRVMSKLVNKWPNLKNIYSKYTGAGRSLRLFREVIGIFANVIVYIVPFIAFKN